VATSLWSTLGLSAPLLAASVVTMLVGCVPTVNTIGGHTDAELQQWAAEAQVRCVRRTHREPPYPFTTDGCTLSPDCTWQMCCVEHDMEYWCGGSATERAAADTRLQSCVAAKGGGRTLARLMYWAVRIAAHPLVPAYWRWGYGWSWLHGYSDETDQLK